MLFRSLSYLEHEIETRRKVAQLYLKLISNPHIVLPRVQNRDGHVWHLFVIRTKEREVLQKYLNENGVQSLIHYPIPPHRQKAFEKWNNLNYPVTEKIHNEVLSLPVSSVMEQIDGVNICDLLNNYAI